MLNGVALFFCVLCVNRRMKKRIADLEAREKARAALDPFGLNADHAAEHLAAQALDLWETEALLAVSDAEIPELPGYSDIDGLELQPLPPAQSPRNPRVAQSYRSAASAASVLARRTEVLERRDKMIQLAAGLPLAALEFRYQQEFRRAIERRTERRQYVLQNRASQDALDRALAQEDLVETFRSALALPIESEQHQDSVREWEEQVSCILRDCTVAEDIESEMLLSLEAAEDAAEVSKLSHVKAEALIRETVRTLFKSLDQDGNGRLDRCVHARC